MEINIFERDIKQHTSNQPMKAASDARSLDETRHMVFGYVMGQSRNILIECNRAS